MIFVLVHGGWHGGWCWDALADRLRANGHEVHAPTLTGLADRAHLIDWVDGPEDHVADITTLIKYHDLRDIALVGHSYGGMITTGVASRMPDLIRHLVYLDAFVPTRPNQAADDLAPPERRAMMRAWLAENDGHIPPQRIETWAKLDETRAWLASKVTPHPRGCFGKGLDLLSDPSTLDLQRHYILCAANHPSAFWQFFDLYKDNPRWTTYQLDCLHDAMIEAPDALAALLDELG